MDSYISQHWLLVTAFAFYFLVIPLFFESNIFKIFYTLPGHFPHPKYATTGVPHNNGI